MAPAQRPLVGSRPALRRPVSSESRLKVLPRLLRQHPRLAAALSFGISTALLTHFAWYSSARWNGQVPALTLAAGLAHGIAGAVTGPRLLDSTRTRSSRDAALLGAATSLLALLLFAPAMAAYVSATNVSPQSPLAFLALTLYTGLFAFLAVGWGLLLLSVVVAIALYRLLDGGRGRPHFGDHA
jgi:hypothetical protein